MKILTPMILSTTVWLQISVVEYFRDFREFCYDHENFCYEIFLTAAFSTALDTSKSQKIRQDHESLRPWKFGAIRYHI